MPPRQFTSLLEGEPGWTMCEAARTPRSAAPGSVRVAPPEAARSPGSVFQHSASLLELVLGDLSPREPLLEDRTRIGPLRGSPVVVALVRAPHDEYDQCNDATPEEQHHQEHREPASPRGAPSPHHPSHPFPGTRPLAI